MLVTSCLLLCLAGAQPTAQSATLDRELLKDWTEMKSTMMALANEMPEDGFAFKATPPQRDFAQQILHIAQANVLNLRFLAGKATPPTIDRSARSKAAVMRAMADSFDYGTALIMEQTEQSLLEIVPTNQFLGPSSRARVIYFLLGHTWDIYGQMVVYLRLNGGVPPASQRP
jgi:hypothetical protein